VRKILRLNFIGVEEMNDQRFLNL